MRPEVHHMSGKVDQWVWFSHLSGRVMNNSLHEIVDVFQFRLRGCLCNTSSMGKVSWNNRNRWLVLVVASRPKNVIANNIEIEHELVGCTCDDDAKLKYSSMIDYPRLYLICSINVVLTSIQSTFAIGGDHKSDERHILSLIYAIDAAIFIRIKGSHLD